jgi:hypothetical protein
LDSCEWTAISRRTNKLREDGYRELTGDSQSRERIVVTPITERRTSPARDHAAVAGTGQCGSTSNHQQLFEQHRQQYGHQQWHGSAAFRARSRPARRNPSQETSDYPARHNGEASQQRARRRCRHGLDATITSACCVGEAGRSRRGRWCHLATRRASGSCIYKRAIAPLGAS